MDRKSIFLALFIFIIIVFSLYFSLEENPIITPESPAENQQLPEAELQGVELTIYNDQQNHRLRLLSEQVKRFESEQRLDLKPVKIKVFNKSTGELLYTLTGDSGSYYSSRGYIELRGNVVVESDRYQIKSAALDYYLNRNYLEGRGSVKITGSGFNSRAQSFRSDLNLNNLKLFGNEDQAEINFDNLDE
ncbi:LPS export ABC transporter protein LptC [Halanaerobium saccharolyticum]|uniref:LPS export ABC transporter protein LptC n=1 Tax=Halanaerobium saccharolyticum TaxID=43595 RepID=A0A4R6M2B3_9FIRM|nr:LPS export ABC transporter periplasmic protein LptC [Halanaerobium saccharolyticum]TDO95106.1 LPS export ABC transporter protein LptC [Halanaerobium saccharolyticum]